MQTNDPVPPFIKWQTPAEAPELVPGFIDIWSFPLDGLPCQPEVLAPEELRRLKSHRRKTGRQQYCAARTALRTILGRYLKIPPENLDLIIKAGGKPRLLAEPPPLYFNLSHASNIALLAVCADHKIGVDLETVRQLPDARRIARRIFSKQEIKVLSQDNWSLDTFYRFWTTLEARQKCLGRGVFSEIVKDELVQTRVIKLAPEQFAAIAWPAASKSPEFNFYRL